MTITITASSPKSSLKRSVAWNESVEESTSVSVAALGSSRRASAAPPRANIATTARVSSGRRAAARAIPPKRSPITPSG